MFVSRAFINDLMSRLSAAESRAETLERLRAVQQQNFDWLANHVNRLEIERSTLLQRVLGVGFVAPQIVKDPTAPPPNIVGGVPVQDRPDDEDTGMGLAALQASSFEDMGDQAAQAFGVQHDPKTGSVIYTR